MPRAAALMGWAVHYSHGLILCSCLPAPAGPWLGPWGGSWACFFQGLPQSRSRRALWKALPAGSSCAGAIKPCSHCWPTAHTKITV